MGVYDHGHRAGMLSVEGHDPGRIDVADNVCIDDQQSILLPEIGNIADAPAGAQYFRFMAHAYLPRIVLACHKGLHLRMQVVDVHDDAIAAGLEQASDCDIQYRLPVYGEQRFGCVPRIGCQSRAEPGGQNHGFHGYMQLRKP